jgi:hypothetical protein
MIALHLALFPVLETHWSILGVRSSETTWMLFDLIQPNGCCLAKTNISNIKNKSILQISTVEKEKNIHPKHSHLTTCSPKLLLFKNCHVLVGGFNHLEEY